MNFHCNLSHLSLGKLFLFNLFQLCQAARLNVNVVGTTVGPDFARLKGKSKTSFFKNKILYYFYYHMLH